MSLTMQNPYTVLFKFFLVVNFIFNKSKQMIIDKLLTIGVETCLKELEFGFSFSLRESTSGHCNAYKQLLKSVKCESIHVFNKYRRDTQTNVVWP